MLLCVYSDKLYIWFVKIYLKLLETVGKLNF